MPITPTIDQIQAVAAAGDDGPVVMLNLLRFKDRADGINEADGITGAEAYGRYAAGVPPFLQRVGGRLLQAGVAQHVFIGPEEKEWDMVLMVEYPSPAAFLTMATDPDYLEVHKHRDSALSDSRLIVCAPVSM